MAGYSFYIHLQRVKHRLRELLLNGSTKKFEITDETRPETAIQFLCWPQHVFTQPDFDSFLPIFPRLKLWLSGYDLLNNIWLASEQLHKPSILPYNYVKGKLK